MTHLFYCPVALNSPRPFLRAGWLSVDTLSGVPVAWALRWGVYASLAGRAVDGADPALAHHLVAATVALIAAWTDAAAQAGAAAAGGAGSSAAATFGRTASATSAGVGSSLVAATIAAAEARAFLLNAGE